MSLRNWVKSCVPPAVLARLRAIRARFAPPHPIQAFVYSDAREVREDIARKYGEVGDMLTYFAGHDVGVVHKWHHYIPLYERYFAPYRGRPVRLLEIGVSKGGSLWMWRRYFGPDAVIYGIDIDPACAAYDGVAGQVRIGSQVDVAFLHRVVDEMGGVDIVLDDGSHLMEHLPVTLEALFGRLSDGGLYMVEDLHTAYWREYGGGYGSRRNFFRYVDGIIADMHRWYHRHKLVHPAVSARCTGIHIHDSMVILEKGPVYPPVSSQVGTEAPASPN
ncbi:class I SAM-dependent methyltransferase [Ancylobacter sp. IITR112]|uniref:class I SAM-dependent methyltransferase n=1 Tax=Ancylobacter sp. IITR112 TaxID=3138073 RepID=UPI00352AA4AA